MASSAADLSSKEACLEMKLLGIAFTSSIIEAIAELKACLLRKSSFTLARVL